PNVVVARAVQVRTNALCRLKGGQPVMGKLIASAQRGYTAVGAFNREVVMFDRLCALLLAVSFFTLSGTAHAVRVGDMAPDFQLPGADGKTYQLSDYRDKQAVVLAWFPKANTYGCTIECKSLAENGDKIRQFD